MASTDHLEIARTQALCWLLDELFEAEGDLLELVARPEALSGWRRERLVEFCQRVAEEFGCRGKGVTHPCQSVSKKPLDSKE